MSNPTYIKMTGWVTKDPQLRRTNGDGTSVCTIRLGTASRWLDRTSGEWREGQISYFDVVCWRGLAVNAAMSLRKGHMVTIHGTFRNRAWTDKDNNPRISLEITANSVGHDLTYGMSHYVRSYRAPSRSAGELPEGEASRALDTTRDGAGRHGEPAQGEPAQGEPAQGEPARWPEEERRERNPFHAGESGDFGETINSAETGTTGTTGEAGVTRAIGETSETDEAGATSEAGATGEADTTGERADPGPSAGPAYEPAGERVSGAGDEGGDADTAEGAADEPRREEVAVPV